MLRSESYNSSRRGSVDDETNSVVRHRLDPNEARTHFLPAKVKADDVDFSDRIDGKRKSYRTSSRRDRHAAQQGQEIGGSSDDEEGTTVEGLKRRIARLHRETEETKSEIERRQDARKVVGGDEASDEHADEHALKLLSSALDELKVKNLQQISGAEARLLRKIKTPPGSIPTHDTEAKTRVNQQDMENSSYTVASVPDLDQGHALARIADFETRLTMLETILGIESIPLPIQDKDVSKTILPTLDELDKQISILTSASPSSLDAVSKRVRQLIQDAEKLNETRRSAKAAQDALNSSKGAATPPSKRNLKTQDGTHNEPEQTSKINALFGTLATIESLAPLLPSVLGRLRSLRYIHADAATAGQNLASIEKRQAEMAEDIKVWKEGLEKVEATIKGGEVTMTENVKTVEGWVNELHKRLSDLGM